MTNEQIFFNFKMNPYFLEDINTSYGPVLKDLMEGDTSSRETYSIRFLSKCDYTDAYTESSNTWSNSFFNPTNGILDENHCLDNNNAGIDENKYSVLNVDSNSIENLHLIWSRVTGSRGGILELSDNSSITADFGNEIVNLAGMFFYNTQTKYVLAYAMTNQEIEVSGQFNAPWISGTKYGRVLTQIGGLTSTQ